MNRSFAVPKTLLAGALLVAGCTTEEATPAADLPDRTPLEAVEWTQLTPHAEMMEFLDAVASASPNIELRSMGSSVEGRDLPYLQVSSGAFGEDRNARTMVLIFASQHGNEPSGKEASLELVLELARGDHDDILEEVDLLLVPQVNPDGGERHQRTNAEGVDLNRSHLILNGPEVEALRELFHEWEPEVAVDVHEYFPWSDAWLERGWLRLFDVQIGLATNLNTPAPIRAASEERFLSRIVQELEEDGFTAHNYIVGSPDGLRWSTTNINDGRQGFAILHTLSFIYEGKRDQEPAGNIRRRAAGQRAAMESLLRFAAEEGDEIRRTVRQSRERARAGGIETFHLTMGRDHGDGPLEIPVEQVVQEGDEWVVQDTATAVIEEWRPEVTQGRNTALPEGYLIPGTLPEVIRLLERHRVRLEVLDEGSELQVERLTIEGFSLEELENPTPIPDVIRQAEAYTAGEGDVFVPTAQLRGLMVATALEPESMHALLGTDEFGDLAQEGPYPILRVVER
jgi:hypothetical protein